MRHVTLGAFLPRVVLMAVDLFMPLGTGRIGLMAVGASRGVQFVGLVFLRIRKVRVRLAGAVADFAGKRLVPELANLQHMFGMAFIARQLTRVVARQTGALHQGVTAIPAVLAKGFRREKMSGHHVAGHDADGQKHQPHDLRR